MAEKEPNTDDIIKYLGFQIHPGKIEEFWKSEDEKKQYLAGVKARGGETSLLQREGALLNARLMTPVDRAISIFGSFLLIIAFFLPVYSFDAGGKHISGSAISYFLNIPVIGGYASWGGGIMLIAMILFSLILITCPIVGVLNILGLMNKHKGDEYLAIVKEKVRFALVPMGLFILLFLVLIIGAPQPFGTLGTEALGDTLNLGAIFKLTGIGFWLNIAGLALLFAEARGI